MKQQKRALAGVAALIFFAALTASGSAQEKAQAQDEGQTRIALAEKYLFDYYKKSKSARKTAGIVGLGGGALFMGIGAAMIGGEDDWLGFNDFFGGLSVVMGGIMIVGGAASLAFPSPAEKAYDKIQPIQDPLQREKACADALAGFAKSGRRMRMIGGGLTLATGVLMVATAGGDETSTGYLAWAAVFGGVAAYQFLVKSRPEKIYRAYLEESQVKPTPRLSLGLGPHGTLLVGLTIEF
jgi:hypothetical protein